jgi:hypothetical protein
VSPIDGRDISDEVDLSVHGLAGRFQVRLCVIETAEGLINFVAVFALQLANV